MNKNTKKSLTTFKPLHLIIFAVIIGIAGWIIIRSQAAPNPPSIYLTPASQTFGPSQTFTVQLRANSGSTPINAVDATITYPTNLIDFVSVSEAGSAFNQGPSSIGGNGKVTVSKGSLSAKTNDQLAATITFKTKTTSGSGTLAFTGDPVLAGLPPESLNVLGSPSNAIGGSVTVDAMAPTTSVTAPANGTSIAAGSSVTITSSAQDASLITKVEVLIDGSVKTTLPSAPYNYTWNTSGLAPGNHTIQTKATDQYGNVGISSIITVSLDDKTPPTVSITAPANNATVQGNVPINVNASDNSGGTGVAKVEFYVDGALKNTDTTAPYSYTWDSKTVPDGSHTINAKAFDKASPTNAAPSQNTIITVSNTDTAKPSTPTNLRVTASSLNSITLAWGASTDNVAVTGYRIIKGSTTLSTTTNLTFSDTSLTEGTTYNYQVVALDAAGNVSNPATISATTTSRRLGDVNGDGKVDLQDITMIINTWRSTTDLRGDFNKNGKIDIFDLSILLYNYDQ